MSKNYYVVNVDFNTFSGLIYEEVVIGKFSSKKAAEEFADKIRKTPAQGSYLYVTDTYPTEKRNYI